MTLKFKPVLHALLLALSLLLSTASASENNNQSIYQRAITSPDRPAKDLNKDRGRKPEKILPFTQIKPGDKVLELGAGGGYTTELLARVVGDSGKVFAQGLNQSRVASGRLSNVVKLRQHLLYQLEDVMAENQISSGQLDSVVIFFAFHDFYLNPKMDKQAILATLHRLLKPDGSLILLDNAADPDAGTSVNRRLHRIGENFVVAELAKAGFVVESRSDALRNSLDDHTKPWQSFNGLHDRFAFRLVKAEK